MGRAAAAKKLNMTIEGEPYVAIRAADYARLVGDTDKDALAGSVEAGPFMAEAIGADLRAAREHAGLTQAQLAKKLRKTQPMVSGAETGSVHVGERYILAVLKACGLPSDWKAPAPKAPAPRAPAPKARPQSRTQRRTGVKERDDTAQPAWPGRRVAG